MQALFSLARKAAGLTYTIALLTIVSGELAEQMLSHAEARRGLMSCLRRTRGVRGDWDI